MQFAEPVWEEEEVEGETIYTPRAPEDEDEYQPSTILTGAHRVKTDQSPLYLGDMTSTAGGLAYVRAVIKNVDIDDGEVVSGSGTTDVYSVWVAVHAKVEQQLVTLDGRKTGCFSIYCDQTSTEGGTPIVTNADEIRTLAIMLDGPLQSDAVDTLSLELNGTLYELEETGVDTKLFCATSSPTLAIDAISDLTEEAYDVARVRVSFAVEGIDDRTMILKEQSPESSFFEAQRGALAVGFSEGLNSGTVDLAGVTILGGPYRRGSRTLLTESSPGSKIFLDLNTYSGLRLTLVETPGTFDPESPDTILCRVSQNDSSEWDDWYIRLNETGDDTMFFMSEFQTGTETPEEPDPEEAEKAVNRLIVRQFPAVYGTTDAYYAVTAAGMYTFTIVSRGFDFISDGLILCAMGTQDVPEVDLPEGTELGVFYDNNTVTPVLVTSVKTFKHVVKYHEGEEIWSLTLFQDIADVKREKGEWAIRRYETLGCILHELGFFLSDLCRRDTLWLYGYYDRIYLGHMGYMQSVNHGTTPVSFAYDLFRAGQNIDIGVALPISILLVDCHGDFGQLEFPWLQLDHKSGSLFGFKSKYGPSDFWPGLNNNYKHKMSKLMANQHPQLVYFRCCDGGQQADEWRSVMNADVFVGWSESLQTQHLCGFGNDILRLSWENMYIGEDKRLPIGEIVSEANKRLKETYELQEGANREQEDPYCICKHLWPWDLLDGETLPRPRGTYPEPLLIMSFATGAEDTILKTAVDYETDPFYDYPKYLDLGNPSYNAWRTE